MIEQANLVPRRRFKEFHNTYVWEQRRFDSVFDAISNNTLSRANLNYDSGKIKSIHYGDILTKYGAIIDCEKHVIPFITGAEVSDYQSQLLQDGDVLIADAAEDETVGKTTEIARITDIPVVSGLHTIACRPKVKMQSNYLGYYMNSPSYRQQLLPLMQGIKVLSISRTNLAKTVICYPTNAKEQSQIGAVFANLDHLITLHQRKLEKTKALKSACLSEMFPTEGEREPKRRFAGFTGAWEQRKLGDVKDVRDGTHDSPKYHNEGHPLVTSKNLTEHGLDMTDVSLISDEDFNAINQRSKVDVGDIIFGMIGTIGNPVILKRNDFAIKNVALIKRAGGTENEFLIQLLKSPVFDRYIKKENAGGTQKFLGLSQIRNFEFLVPSKAEQEKIGDFFSNLDNLITLHQRKLEKLQSIKKAYLNEMFV